MAILFREVRQGVHLVGTAIAGHLTDPLQGHLHDAVAGDLVGNDVVAGEPGKGRVRPGRLEPLRTRGQGAERHEPEAGPDPRQFQVGQVDLRAVHGLPFRVGLAGELRRPEAGDQDLDPGLVEVVAPTEAVVDPQDRGQVAQQVLGGQMLADRGPDIGRAPHSTADDHLETQPSLPVPPQDKADIVRPRGRPVLGRGGDGDLELARQVGEFRVEGGPLADHLAPHPGIVHLFGGRTGERVGGGVADAVAAGLDGMQLRRRQIVQHVRRVGQLDPVELNILPCGEVTVALVPAPRHMGERPHLGRAQGPIGNGHPQHVAVQLEVQTVHQPKGLELLLTELSGQSALDLVAELRVPVRDHRRVYGVVVEHHFLRIRPRRPDERAAPLACCSACTSTPPSACGPMSG